MSGVYIHIPFCHSKCAYCDFYSTPNRKKQELLIDCLIREMRMRREEIVNIDTIYIGGGTPSILRDEELWEILSCIDISHAREVTMEVNPEDVNRDRVRSWKSMGVNRISMGIQSFVDAELQLIGRRHSSEDALIAIEDIRAGGISNFSIDLIYGIPGQTTDSWKYSLDTLKKISPEHFSAYMLTYEPQTRLTAMLKTGKIVEVEENTVIDMYMMLVECARTLGYEHYEISNFAKPGARSKHNSSYWNGTPYIGVGPGAHGYDGTLRKVNPADINIYIAEISQNRLPYVIEKESKTDIFNDMIITALRTERGLDFRKVERRRRRQLLCDAFPYLKRREIVAADNHLFIPEEHWLIADAIMRDLLQ